MPSHGISFACKGWCLRTTPMRNVLQEAGKGVIFTRWYVLGFKPHCVLLLGETLAILLLSYDLP